jgi:hypothetical protein
MDAAVERETKGWRFAVSSGILCWVLDVLDFPSQGPGSNQAKGSTLLD